MNGKCTASDGLLPDPKNKISLNPFVHTLELTSTYEKIKAGLLTVIILPIRLCVIMCLLIAAWLIACVGLYGITEEELQEKPLTGWRRVGRSAATKLIRSMMFVIGFHWLHVKGKLATKDEAPVIVTSPHSTFFDILPVVYMGAPSPVTRVENLSIPLFGSMSKAMLFRLTYISYLMLNFFILVFGFIKKKLFIAKYGEDKCFFTFFRQLPNPCL
uniref:Phospholipid/glycerol acyltransferase domain-containing protein n=1 Tax=Clastoptera arizonana TaxID=38151 RepID=A0A1B6CA35_9HEMI